MQLTSLRQKFICCQASELKNTIDFSQSLSQVLSWKLISAQFITVFLIIWIFSGIHFMRNGNSFSRLRHDLFRRYKRNLFVTFRIADEVHRSESFNDFGICSTRLPNMGIDYLEATSKISSHILHHIRPMGSWWCCVADSS